MRWILWASLVGCLFLGVWNGEVHAQGRGVKPVATDHQGDPLPPGALQRMGTARLRHGGPVRCLALDPDGALLASAGDDRIVRLWEIPGGKEVKTFQGHYQGIQGLAYSLDGKLLAAAGDAGFVQLWDVRSGKELGLLDGTPDKTAKPTLSAVAFSPDGKQLISAASDGLLRLWNPATRKLQGSLEGHKEWIYCVTFSRDGKFLASCDGDENIFIWDVATGKVARRLKHAVNHRNSVLAFSDDGKRLVSCGADVRIWDVASGKQLESFPHEAIKAALAPDGKLFSTVNMYGKVMMWQTPSDPGVWGVAQSGNWVHALAFTPDRKLIASAGDGRIRIWNVAREEEAVRFAGHQDGLTAVTFTPDGKQVVTASTDGSVRVWDALTSKEVRTIPGKWGLVHTIAYSPDGKRLAFGDRYKGKVTVLDTDREVEAWSLGSPKAWIGALAFSADGKHLATGAGGSLLQIWDGVNGKEVRTFPGSVGPECMAFAPNGKLLATPAGAVVRLWDAGTGKQQERVLLENIGGKDYPYEAIVALAFSPDSKRLASGGAARTLCVSDVATGKPIWTTRLRCCTNPVVFSPCGKLLAAGKWDGKVGVWEAATGKEVALLNGHRDEIRGLAFSRDGRQLASASKDTTVVIWDATRFGGGGK